MKIIKQIKQTFLEYIHAITRVQLKIYRQIIQVPEENRDQSLHIFIC